MSIELFAQADTVANSDLVRTLIQLVAYVTPFFLIPLHLSSEWVSSVT
jgi:hypothetical protein